MDDVRIQALIHAVDGGSFSAAARAMGYTPAGILRLVGALEDELGVSLLERSSQGVHLTRAGEELLPDLREISVLMDRTRRRAHTIASPYEGTVSLGCARSVAGSWLAPVVAQFVDAYPDVVVQLREGATPELMGWLTQREVDLCVGGCQPKRFWEPLGQSAYAALVPADHPYARRASLTLEDFDREPMVQINPRRGTNTDVLLAEKDVHPDVRFYTSDLTTAKAMVGAGLGICLTIDLVGSVAGTGAVVVPICGVEPFVFGIAHRGCETLSAPAAALVRELEAHRAPELA